MIRPRDTWFAFFLLAACTREPHETPPVPPRPAPVPNHPCSADADCHDLEPPTGASWQCVAIPDPTAILQPSDAPRACTLFFANGERYCDTLVNCPPPDLLADYSETVACTDHHCIRTRGPLPPAAPSNPRGGS